MDMEARLRTADWKQIKTAPKDGRNVDLWFSRPGIGYRPNCFWQRGNGWVWFENVDGAIGLSCLPNLRPNYWIEPLNPDQFSKNPDQQSERATDGA